MAFNRGMRAAWAVLGVSFILTGCVSVTSDVGTGYVRGPIENVCDRGYDPDAAAIRAEQTTGNAVDIEYSARRAQTCKAEYYQCQEGERAVQDYLPSTYLNRRGYPHRLAGQLVGWCVDTSTGEYVGEPFSLNMGRRLERAVAPRKFEDSNFEIYGQAGGGRPAYIEYDRYGR